MISSAPTLPHTSCQVRAENQLPAELFSALEVEPVASRTSLQEALAALANVHALASGRPPPPPQMLAALRFLLLTSAGSNSQHARYSSMVWVGAAFERDDIPTRYACLLAIADTRAEVAEAAAKALRPAAPASSQSPSSSTTASAPPPPTMVSLALGCRVTHCDSGGHIRTGRVLAVHTNAVQPSSDINSISHGGHDSGHEGGSAARHECITIRYDGGGERCVESTSLYAMPARWPPLAPLATLLLKHVALTPAPLSVELADTEGSPANIDAEEAVALPAEVTALPADSISATNTHPRLRP